MSTPKVIIDDTFYKVILSRDDKDTELTFLIKDFNVVRSDDAEDNTGRYPDEDGYYYYIFGLMDNEVSISLEPEEAESIVEQIFKATGNHVNDY